MSYSNSDDEAGDQYPTNDDYEDESNECDGEETDGEEESSGDTNSDNEDGRQLLEGFERFVNLYWTHPRGFSNMLAQPFRTSVLTGPDWLQELFTGHPQRFYDALRLDKEVFILLCDKVLETGCYPQNQQTKVGIHECVAIFLVTIGLHHRQVIAAERFQRSPETISRHIHHVVNALCAMAPEYIRPPNFDVVPEWIRRNNQLFPYFKDCVGAIDGTIIPAWVPNQRHGTYRCRRGTLAQNVMAACDFDMNFTFVLAGWEGSANDSRVLADTLSQPEYNFPWPPQGKYYAVDSGYSNFPGFLTPYRGERYHLPEWVGQNSVPNSARELFNRRHATVRNVIERVFGSLKQRFKIIKGLMPNYALNTQSDIVIGCCVIHNFVRRFNQGDNILHSMSFPEYIPEPDPEDETIPLMSRQMDTSTSGIWEQSQLRDNIAQQLWNAQGRGH